MQNPVGQKQLGREKECSTQEDETIKISMPQRVLKLERRKQVYLSCLGGSYYWKEEKERTSAALASPITGNK